MTYGELLTQIKANCGGRDDDDFLASAMFNTNAILTWLSTQSEWEELQKKSSPSLVIGQRDYLKSSLGLTLARKVYSIRLFDGTRWKEPMTYNSKVSANSRPIDASGYPTEYSKFSDTYSFDLSPDKAYLLEIAFYSKPTPVTSLESPIEFADLSGPIAYLVSGICLLGLGDRTKSDSMMKLGAAQLGDLNIDVKSIPNLVSPSSTKSGNRIPSYADPFSRR